MNLRPVVLFLFLSFFLSSKGDGIIRSHCSDSLLHAIVAPGHFTPVPLASSPYWRKILPEEMRNSYIALGERHLGKPWPSLPATLFAEYKSTGNRVRYESACFSKRTMLAELVMAEIAEGRGRFLNAIIDGLWSHFEESWWGIPAHYDSAYPLPAVQPVDLFNSETASLIAWTTYILSDSLDSRSPAIRKRAIEEISRRLLIPALTTDYWWKRAGMNWNPWICSNWLSCILLCETDRQRQLSAISQIMDALDVFMSSYPADGGCDEGPGYWDRAAASLYESLRLLSLASDGKFDMSSNEKLHAMGSYSYKTYIQNGFHTNFADSHSNKSLLQVNILYPFGEYLRDATMTKFAKYLWQGDNKAGDTYSLSGNFPTLGRELLFLVHYPEFSAESSHEPLLSEVWLPNLQIMSARDTSGLYFAMKGGHNDESHNHNDVGNFIVYADGNPLLIDIGVGEYTAQTFSSSRYSVWTMQSCFHNLPRINGIDQSAGKSFAARDVRHGKRMMSMDLSGAYPPEAHVKRWERSVSLRGETVSVAERYELSEHSDTTCVMLMTPVMPVLGNGDITLGRHHISYSPSVIIAVCEDVSSRLDPLLQKIWGTKMYRLKLILKDASLKGTIRYQIR